MFNLDGPYMGLLPSQNIQKEVWASCRLFVNSKIQFLLSDFVIIARSLPWHI